MNPLQGKKTYISLGIVAIASLLYGFGLITREQFEAIGGVGGALGGMALRQALTNK